MSRRPDVLCSVKFRSIDDLLHHISPSSRRVSGSIIYRGALYDCSFLVPDDLHVGWEYQIEFSLLEPGLKMKPGEKVKLVRGRAPLGEGVVIKAL